MPRLKINILWSMGNPIPNPLPTLFSESIPTSKSFKNLGSVLQHGRKMNRWFSKLIRPVGITLSDYARLLSCLSIQREGQGGHLCKIRFMVVSSTSWLSTRRFDLLGWTTLQIVHSPDSPPNRLSTGFGDVERWGRTVWPQKRCTE